jgi:hypothetical protein
MRELLFAGRYDVDRALDRAILTVYRELSATDHERN